MRTAKGTKTWLWIVGISILAVTGASAQMELDVAVTGIGVEVSGEDFRVLPSFRVVGLANMESHPLDLHILLDGAWRQTISGLVDHATGTWSCYETSSADCETGNCPDMWWNGLDVPGNCYYWNLGRCGCSWDVTEVSDWWVYNLEQMVTVIADPAFDLPDLDWSNNTMTMELEPVPTEPRSWSAVKALYR